MKNLRSLFPPTGAQPLFSFSGAEGFFGLMVDNLVQYIPIVILLTGLVALSQGFMLSSVVWAATAVCLVERRLGQAAAWMGVGAVMAFFGFIHVGEISVEGGLYSLGFATGAKWAAGYALTAAFFMIVSHVNRKRSSGQTC